MVSDQVDGIDLDTTVDAAARARSGTDAPDSRDARAIVGRYLLREPLGQGGHGVVWAADDLLVGRAVAVKLLAAQGGLEPARVRREVSALRMLRVPGVVQLYDEGIDRGQPFLVMELVAGTPFPGARLPRTWDEIADPTRSLLETVARIHAAGVLHRDLKPGNVLVSTDQSVTVLDFGLSFGSALGSGLTGSSAILGTPAYLPPEQLRGDPVTARTDLYAVGIMLYQALSGRLPHDAERVSELLRARVTRPPDPLAGVAPDVAPAVAAVVEALLRAAPDERPASADEVLARLGLGGRPTDRPLALRVGAAVEASAAPAGERDAPVGAAVELDEEGLRALFAGPDRIFHLQRDGGRVLFSHTRGDPERVSEEVSAWVRAGFARWDGARLAIDRDALDRLEIGLGLAPPLPEAPQGLEMWPWAERREAHRAAAEALPPGTTPRLWHLVLADGGGSVGARTEVAREARVLARQLAQVGRLGQAMAALGEALLAVRRRPLARGAREDTAAGSILATWVEVAMAESSPRALDRILYELCRAQPRSPHVQTLEELVRAALALGAGGERALAMAEAVAPFSDRGLERRRQGLRVLAARRCPIETEEAVLEDVARWVERTADPEAHAALSGWTGRLRYRQGRFEEAARLHADAASRERWATARVNAQLNAASALLEAFLFEEASAAAIEARGIAAGCRHPYFEARAEWIARSAAYRSGAGGEPDLELCDVATRVGVVDLEALICLNEAAVAWRSERRSRAVALAARAHRLWKTNGWRAGALLARCLAVGAGDSAPSAELDDLAAEARACAVPGIGLQALGLVALAAKGRPAAPVATLRPLARAVPRECWRRRMDVTSVAEAAEALGVPIDVLEQNE